MAVEIERKFLVQNDGWKAAAGRGSRIRQGYLVAGPLASVRIRVSGNQAWLNIKGRTIGVTRAEFDYDVPRADAERILDELCSGGIIEKTRYQIEHGNHVWEVDVFSGDNAGLVVAEIELGSESETFFKPDWAGKEVSHDPRYFNAGLAEHPYRLWSEKALT